MAQFPLKFMINGTSLDVHHNYGVYISQLIRFARASSNVSDFNCRNKALIVKLLKQGYRYHKLRKVFLSFIIDTVRWLKNIMLPMEISATRPIGTRILC